MLSMVIKNHVTLRFNLTEHTFEIGTRLFIWCTISKSDIHFADNFCTLRYSCAIIVTRILFGLRSVYAASIKSYLHFCIFEYLCLILNIRSVEMYKASTISRTFNGLSLIIIALTLEVIILDVRHYPYSHDDF